MSQVLGVVIEHDQEGFKPVSLEVISAARKLADQVSGKVVVFIYALKRMSGSTFSFNMGRMKSVCYNTPTWTLIFMRIMASL